MIPQGTLETEELIGNLITSAKNAVGLASDSLDRKLQAGVRQLYDAALQVGRRLVEVEKENRQLREARNRSGEPVQLEKADEDILSQTDPDSTLCPKCLQSSPSATIALTPSRDSHGAKILSCSVCGYHRTDSAQWTLWNTGAFTPILQAQKRRS